MCFLEVMVEFLCLLPICTPLTVLAFALVHGVAKAGVSGGRSLFLGMDAGRFGSTRGGLCRRRRCCWPVRLNNLYGHVDWGVPSCLLQVDV